MKKNILKTVALLSALLVTVGSLGACGAASKEAYNVDDTCYDYVSSVSDAEEADGDFGLLTESKSLPAEVNENDSAVGEAAAAASSRKLIKDGSFCVQTNDFDTFTTKLELQITALGGYVESRCVSGNSYGYDDCRNAEIVARIPATKFDAFTETVSSLGTVTSQNETVRDITSNYIDTESHITALKTEQEALLEIMKKATTVSETIEVQSRLTEVRAELESYQAQLKTFDDLIAYSTVTVLVDEVERVTAVEKEGFFAEIRSRLGDNFYSLGQGLRSFAVWFISSLPYILFFAVIALAVFLPVCRIIKKRKTNGKVGKRKAKGVNKNGVAEINAKTEE